MPDEVNGVTENSPSPLVEAIASTPEVKEEAQQAQETQTPAKEEVAQEQEQQPEEEARIPYSRLKEVVDEKNWLKAQLEQQLQRQPQQQFQQPTQAPQELGNTPEEREFWRMQRQIAREEAEKVTQERMGKINPVIEAGRMELVQMKVQQFRQSHPDIKPNSPEELDIAGRIQQGFTPDDAYKLVMFDKVATRTATQVKQEVKQQFNDKKKANVETSASIPIQSQASPKLSFREQLSRNMELAEQNKL